MIRNAEDRDTLRLIELIHQVDRLHQNLRPDIFKNKFSKYTSRELENTFFEDIKPIFVYENGEDGVVYGCVFCHIIEHKSQRLLQDIKTLYIDNICVDKTVQGQHIGESMYKYVCDYAKSIGCYNVTLSVWEGNTPALQFYKEIGMQVQKYIMETIL